MSQSTGTAAQLSDKKKAEQLTKFFNHALDLYKHGTPKQLNQIFDDMLSEKTDLEYVKIWLTIFTKKLLETYREKRQTLPAALPDSDTASSTVSASNQTSLLIKFILYRSKWLHANSTHSAVYSNYENFCMTLLSICNHYLPVVLKLLFQHLVPKDISENPENVRAINIKVGNNSFKTRKDLVAYVRMILRSAKLRHNSPEEFAEVSSEQQKFLLELFKYHPKAKAKLHNVSQILIGASYFEKNKPTRCFYIKKSNSEKEDISYLKACNATADAFAHTKMKTLLSSAETRLVELQMSTLLKIHKIYPLSKKHFQAIITESFPHRRLDESIQRVFYTNILKFSLKCPKLHEHIIQNCFERLIMIDAEIKHESRSGSTEPICVTSDSMEMAQKMDWLLITLFDYVEYIFQVQRSFSNQENSFGTVNPRSSRAIKEIFEEDDKAVDRFLEFLDVFELYLLITFESKYVQFVLFYICSFTEHYPSFIELFLSTLIRIIQDEEKSTILRVNSTQYLCSFLTRAKYIPFTVLNDTVGFLLEYMNSFVAQNKDRKLKKHQNSFDLYQIFHYTVQSLTFVFCFRFDAFSEQRALQHMKDFIEQCSSIQNTFYTFQYISARILRRFEEILTKMQASSSFIATIQQIISLQVEGLRKERKLEDSFPFDPHFLKHSSKYLVPYYIFYENYDVDVFMRGYEKTPDSLMNYSNVLADEADSCKDPDSSMMDEGESNLDSLSVASRPDTDASNTNDTALRAKTLQKTELRKAQAQSKRKRSYSGTEHEPAVGKKVDMVDKKVNMLGSH